MTAHMSSAGGSQHRDATSSHVISSSRLRPPAYILATDKTAARAAASALCAPCGKDVPQTCRSPWPPLRGGEDAGPVEWLRYGEPRCRRVESGVCKVESRAEKASLSGGRRASLTGDD